MDNEQELRAKAEEAMKDAMSCLKSNNRYAHAFALEDAQTYLTTLRKECELLKAEKESAEQETDKYKTLHMNMANLAKHASDTLQQVRQTVAAQSSEIAALRKLLEEVQDDWRMLNELTPETESKIEEQLNPK